MDARLYLRNLGWKDGEAFKQGGLKKPILVKHKKDKKGLGSDGNDADVWWERLFDGQLKTLDVTSDSNGVSFETNEVEAASFVRRSMSPLYKMFVKGEGLAGTVGKTDNAHLKSQSIDSKAVVEETDRLMRAKEKGTKRKAEEDEKETTKKRRKEEKKEKKKREKEVKAKDKEKKEKKKVGKEKSPDTKEKKDKKKLKVKEEKKDKKDKKERKEKKDKKEKKEKRRSEDQEGHTKKSKRKT